MPTALTAKNQKNSSLFGCFSGAREAECQRSAVDLRDDHGNRVHKEFKIAVSFLGI